MGGIGGGKQSSSGMQWSRPQMQQDIKALRNALGSFFTGGLQGALANPGGIYGGFANLLGGKEGAAGWQDVLSGNIINPAIMNTAYQAMEPIAARSVRDLGASTMEALGPQGLRFGTDVANITNRGGREIYEGLNKDVYNTGFESGKIRANVLSDMASSFLPMLTGYATSYAPLGGFGQNQSSGWNAQASAGKS